MTQDRYYCDYRFVDVFVTLKRAPESLRQRVEVGQRNGINAQVLSGINAGEQVIAHPDDRVREGVRVAAR